ncbi:MULTISPECIES: ABC-F family ATP-binding cassette domain-containing protein [unclassified Streptomyces]|uniref:ABC-F family ATP-binding cassette domain-containing protein n=1 Tax=unclassified Streptomyces TaxID=2593676 RepID=UPI001B36C32C|nr:MULTISPECIES: ABC-F family ATP-binding cassette domain-containing protein [unclassified Streptomyces]MBQ1109432.1 ABC-F family ATP-binding cassette domain-containing protein [Streptomyces sp. 404i]MDQ0700537.1 macrolide transport system ATP-binding/permease protein [Streptomyces sp. W4I9-2]MDX3486502.1 ABC-F family ATP-binding cassette domain-containing protein [Streptomyces sp. ID05-18]
MHPQRDRAQLAMKDVSKAYGDRSVLDQVTLTVRPGEKTAVIGENGSGKSTLLRLLAGVEQPDTGEITVRFPGGTGYLAQTLDLDPADTVQDAVDAALAELRDLEHRIREAEAGLSERKPGDPGPTDEELAAYGDLLTAYEDRDGYRADARTEAALHGLGLAHLTRDRALATLSGGEQSRLALACVLAAAPELLLLDEPTNHLDARAVGWLEDHLRGHRGTVVVITHDRAFLERVTSVILEVDRDLRTVTRYGDGWDGYRTAKAAARRRWAQEHEEYLTDLARTEELVEAAGARLAATGGDPKQGFGKHRRSHEAKLSGQVRAARTRLDALRRSPVPPPPRPLAFTGRPAVTDGTGPADRDGTATGAGTGDHDRTATGTGTGDHARTLVELDAVSVGDRLRLPSLRVASGARLLVTGENGAGKTTLLRVLAGDLTPDAGTVTRRARIGYLPQELPARPTRRTLLATFAAGRPGFPDEYADELLALGLFRPEDLDVPVASLSVGQQRRLALARLVTRPADLLVLDEPTNHIALSLVEELEQALDQYRGAVVVVSHDRSFRARFTGDVLELRAGRPAGAEPAYASGEAAVPRT